MVDSLQVNSRTLFLESELWFFLFTEKSRMSIKTTVVVRVHGDTPYLRQALHSILKQSVIDQIAILIVVDRPSTLSMEIVYEFISSKKVRVIESSTPGGPNALNVGLYEVKSEFTAILDADDIMESTRIEKQVDFLNNNQDIVVVGSGIKIIDASGQVVGSKKYESDPRIIWENRYSNVPLANPAVLFRTNFVKEIGGYRSFYPYGDDPDLWFRIMERGRISNLPEYLTFYREHDNQLTRIHRKKIILHGLAVHKSARNRAIGKPDLSEIYSSVEEWGKRPLVKFMVQKRLVERNAIENLLHYIKSRDLIKTIMYSCLCLAVNPKSIIAYALRFLRRPSR